MSSGSLAAELSDTDDKARASLAEHFAEWRSILAARSSGCVTTACLAKTSTLPALATGLLAAVEGGYLLSQTAHDPRLMQTSLNAAIAHIMSFAPDSNERASR